MADLPLSSPQEFRWGNLSLVGSLVSFSGHSPRRFATHQFLKSSRTLIEDMERGSRRLEVRLKFTKDPPNELKQFESAVSENPIRLLLHPVAGQFQAFCEGPSHDIDFSKSVTEIEVRVGFVETVLDLNKDNDIPSVSTAAQQVSAAQATSQVATSGYLGALARANTALATTKSAIDQQVNNIEAFTDPVTELVNNIVTLPGVASSIVGALTSVQVIYDILNQNVQDFTDAATDIFDGTLVTAGQRDNVENLLDITFTTGQSLEDQLIASSTTPAGAAEAIGSLEEMLAACQILADAVQKSGPPTIQVTVTRATDIVAFCQDRYPNNVLTRVNDVLSLNHIPNPAAIPAGTVLLVPAT